MTKDRDYSVPLKVGDWVAWGDHDDATPIQVTEVWQERSHQCFRVGVPFAWDAVGTHVWRWAEPIVRCTDPIDTLIQEVIGSAAGDKHERA